MVKSDWVEVEWKMLKNVNTRFVYLTLPTGEDVIVDYKPPFYGLLSFPKIHTWQKFDAYIVPQSDLKKYENFFRDLDERKKYVSKNTMTGVHGVLFSRIFGPLLLTALTVLLGPVLKILNASVVPPYLLLPAFILFFWIMINLAERDYLYKKIPLITYEKRKKYIRFKVKKQLSLTLASTMLVVFLIAGFPLFVKSYQAIFFIAIIGYLGILLTIGLIAPEAKIFVKLNEKNEGEKNAK
jgi:hypothetical protein